MPNNVSCPLLFECGQVCYFLKKDTKSVYHLFEYPQDAAIGNDTSRTLPLRPAVRISESETDHCSPELSGMVNYIEMLQVGKFVQKNVCVYI